MTSSKATHDVTPPRDGRDRGEVLDRRESEGGKQSSFKTLFGTGVGNALEWYDWNVYASFAVYFSTQVFNKADPQSAFLQTMAVFAVGFVARPFGGFVFGWLGDRIGRKHALTAAVVSASVGSLIVAICPTYEQAGWFASALLLVGRLIQGLSHGGELPSAQTYLSEHAPREKRGLFASSIYVTGTIGLIFGLLLGLLLQALLTEEQMGAWGWRIPFAIGALLGVVAIWLRSSMEESEVYEDFKENTAGTKQENVFVSVAKNWKTGLQVVLMTCGLTVAYYIWSVTMASLATSSFGYSASDAFTASLIGNVVFILALPVWGALSDKVGRKPCMLIGLIGSGVLYFPLFALVQGGQMWQLATAISIQLILLAGFLSHAPATYAEMFPTSQRTAGFGIPYAIAIAAFGGTAGYVLTWMGNTTHFAFYSIALLAVSVATILTLPETKGKDLSH
ncbi:MFS transporter [Rothia sp. LK2588]|uniref:MFS transporter n=1 Tax=Rothia sp. LK2588 TaxID=3114369 RepID=UPI0034CF7D56